MSEGALYAISGVGCAFFW